MAEYHLTSGPTTENAQFCQQLSETLREGDDRFSNHEDRNTRPVRCNVWLSGGSIAEPARPDAAVIRLELLRLDPLKRLPITASPCLYELQNCQFGGQPSWTGTVRVHQPPDLAEALLAQHGLTVRGPCVILPDHIGNLKGLRPRLAASRAKLGSVDKGNSPARFECCQPALVLLVTEPAGVDFLL